MDKSYDQSIYNCKGKFGFVYRKVNTRKQQDPSDIVPPHLNTEPLPLNSEPRPLDTEPLPLNSEPRPLDSEPLPLNSEPRPLDSEPLPLNAESQHLDSEPCPLESGPLPLDTEPHPLDYDEDPEEADETISTEISPSELEDLELPRKVELMQFIASLRKMCASSKSGVSTTDSTSDVESALEGLSKDLQETGLFGRYLESEEPAQPPLDLPLSSVIGESVDDALRKRTETLQASISLYQSELKQWEEVIKAREEHMEDAKKAIANEREADFSYLHWDDVETLKSYLTPEQLSLLDQPLLPQPKFVQESREKLDTMNAELDAEMKRIQDRFHHTNLSMRQGSSHPHLGMSFVEETPRTLFRALKQH